MKNVEPTNLIYHCYSCKIGIKERMVIYNLVEDKLEIAANNFYYQIWMSKEPQHVN